MYTKYILTCINKHNHRIESKEFRMHVIANLQKIFQQFSISKYEQAC